MDDQLTVIPVNELAELKELLHRDFPRHIVGYGLVATLVDWYSETEVVDGLQIFTLNGDWKEDGLLVVMDRCDLLVYSMAENNDRLRRALRLVDWNRSWRIVSLDTRSASDALAVLSELHVSWDYNLPFDTLYCPAEIAIKLKYEPPEGVCLRRLTTAEADTVNDLWTYRHAGSVVGVRRLIARNYCVGAFDKATGQLLGWCLTFISQCHNALQIEPKFMGKGLGKLIVAKLARERALQGKWSHAFVSPSNIVSQGLFKSFGFKKIGQALWIGTRARG